MNRILIIKLSSIGDIVHTLPALLALKASFPHAEIDWLVEKKASNILKNHPGLNQVIEVDTQQWRRSFCRKQLYQEMLSCVTQLRRRHYDVAFDFQGLWKSAGFGFVSGCKCLVGFDKAHLKEPSCRILYGQTVSPSGTDTHVIELNQALVRSQGATTGPVAFELNVAKADRSYINAQLVAHGLNEFIILNPGSGWVTKNWAPVNYGLLHNRIKKQLGMSTVLTWGPGEEGLVKEVMATCQSEPPVTFSTTIPQFIALACRARLFVGGDTGPLHLAAACNTPVVGIFGPTDPLRNGPFDKSDLVVSQPVPCGPCYKRTCEKYRCQCLTLVTVEQVFTAILNRMNNSKPKSLTRFKAV